MQICRLSHDSSSIRSAGARTSIKASTVIRRKNMNDLLSMHFTHHLSSVKALLRGCRFVISNALASRKAINCYSYEDKENYVSMFSTKLDTAFNESYIQICHFLQTRQQLTATKTALDSGGGCMRIKQIESPMREHAAKTYGSFSQHVNTYANVCHHIWSW